MSLHFENPGLLWAWLLLIPLSWIVHTRALRFRENPLRKLLVLPLAFFFAILGLSQPQLGRTTSHTLARKGQIFLAVDISRSMLVEDMGTSRLGFAAAFAQKLLEQIPNVKIALFPFAADGYLQMPLTTDLVAVSDMVGNLSPTMTTHQGTDLSQALQTLYTEILKQEKKAGENGSEWAATQVVLISDGETHVPLRNEVLSLYRAKGLPVYAVGAGTAHGGPVPLPARFVNTPEYLREGDNRPVISRFHPETLKQISERTGGAYFAPRFEEAGALSQRLMRSIAMGKLSSTFKVERELYPWLFAISLLLFFLEFNLARWEYALRVLWLLLLPGFIARAADDSKAVDAYNNALEKLKGAPKEAIELFQQSALQADDPGIRKKALYNLGNTYLKMGDPKQAIESYQQAYDTKMKDTEENKETNQRISENLMLAAKIQKMMQNQNNQGRPQEGEGDKGKDSVLSDPKGPRKDYDPQSFSEEEKQRIYDVLAGEEQQILQRIQQGKEGKGSSYVGKPW